MKKSVIKAVSGLLLVGAISASLTGCGSSTPTAPTASTAPTQSSTSAQQPSSGGVKEIKLVASNYEFDQKEIHVKKGEKVKLTLENKQGMHGISIAEFNVDLKKAGSMEFTPDKAGTFDIICSVMCGSGHMTMKAKLIVE